MVKKTKALTKYSIFLIGLVLILIPFGQLLRVDLDFGIFSFTLHPIDCAVLFSFPFLMIPIKSKIINKISGILIIFTISFIFSVIVFPTGSVSTGFLHLLRAVSYYSFARMVNWVLYKSNENTDCRVFTRNEKPLSILLTGLFFSIASFLIFGFIQYLFFSDLTVLKYIGWDDHMNRLLSTMLDPAYSGVILIIGFYLTLYVIKDKYIKYIFAVLFLIAIFLTYSRAAYLSLFVSLIFLMKKKMFLTAVTIFILVISITLFTNKKGEGVNLLRIYSINLRLNNYHQTIKAFSDYPLFGVGFNNICRYKVEKGYSLSNSHACSGSDNSYLLILATTGTVGVLWVLGILYTYIIKNPVHSLAITKFTNLEKAIFLSIAVGALFNNLLFYNFLMAIVAILMGAWEEPSRSKTA